MIKISTTPKGIPLLNLNDVADITQVNNSLNKIDDLLGDKTALDKHEKRKISDEGGVHGLEYLEEDGSLQITKQSGDKVKFESGMNPDELLKDFVNGLIELIEKVGKDNE